MRFISTLAVLLGLFGACQNAPLTAVNSLNVPSLKVTSLNLSDPQSTLVKSNLAQSTPPSPSPSALNTVKDANKLQFCLAKIIQSGLMKLPQLTNTPTPIGFTSLKTQVTAGISYTANYQGKGFKAKISGRCQPWSGQVYLDEASYQNL